MNMNTKVTSKPRLLSELLRPQEIGDLTLPASDIEHLSRMVTSRSIMNMLFYGKPGLGKTAAARAIARLVDTDSCELLFRLASRKRNMSVEVWRDSYKLLEMNRI